MKIEAGQFFDEETFRGILKLEQENFPGAMQYDDGEEYYRNALRNEHYINIVARQNGRVVGYMLITPQPEQVPELLGDDPELEADPECIYVETMEIASEIQKSLRGGKLFVAMVERGVAESLKRGFKRFCTHARKSVGLNEAMKKYFGSRIIRTREIAKWRWVADEPYEFIEGNLKEEIK